MNQITINTLAMWTPGPIEIVVIGVIALLIFGKRLPEMARGLGQSFTQFKKGLKEPPEIKDDNKSQVENVSQTDLPKADGN